MICIAHQETAAEGAERLKQGFARVLDKAFRGRLNLSVQQVELVLQRRQAGAGPVEKRVKLLLERKPADLLLPLHHAPPKLLAIRQQRLQIRLGQLQKKKEKKKKEEEKESRRRGRRRRRRRRRRRTRGLGGIPSTA